MDIEAINNKPVAGEKFSPNLLVIITLIHGLAIFGAIHYFSIQGLWVLAATHTFFASFGIALGYHRYFSHASFVAATALHRILAVVCTLCFQGGPIFWASAHRAHHQFTERVGDPHSATRGFWWSHWTWLFYLRPNGYSYSRAQKLVPDLLSDPFLVFVENHAVWINFVTMGAFAIFFYAIGRVDLFFWTFPIRIVTVWHATWLINSWYHGAKTNLNKRPTGLRNNILADVILGGEGSHRNHHNRPSKMKNSTHWYQFDTSYWLILVFKKVGLVKSYRGQPQVHRGPTA